MAESPAKPVKLNLGCGDRTWPGFTNVDARKSPGVDLVHDLSHPLPFEDGSVDEIHAYHIIEHFYRWEIEGILKDWVAKLKPGGLLVLEAPCLDKILLLFQHHMDKGIKIEPFIIWGLYGDPRYRDPEMTHHWCYAVGELSGIMRNLGLSVEMKQAETHVPVRDMRLEGRKQAIIHARDDIALRA